MKPAAITAVALSVVIVGGMTAYVAHLSHQHAVEQEHEAKVSGDAQNAIAKYDELREIHARYSPARYKRIVDGAGENELVKTRLAVQQASDDAAERAEVDAVNKKFDALDAQK